MCFLHGAMSPTCIPIMDGAPSVAMAATLQRGNFVDAANSMTTLNISSPFVVHFNCDNVSNSSFILKSENVILANRHTCAMSITSVDSSNCELNHSQLSMSIASCSLVLHERHSSRHVTVFRDNGKLAIADLIKVFFLETVKQYISSLSHCLFDNFSFLKRFHPLGKNVRNFE